MLFFGSSRSRLSDRQPRLIASRRAACIDWSHVRAKTELDGEVDDEATPNHRFNIKSQAIGRENRDG